MYRFFKTLKANYLISAGLCILFGITLVVWPDISSRLLCVGLGCVLALTGIVHLVTFFIRRDGTFLSRVSFLIGIVLAVLGCWIIVYPSVLIRLIPVIIGVILTLHGGNDLLQAVQLHRGKYEKWWLAMLFGILTAGFGIFLVCNPFEAVSAVATLIGVFLIFDGISDIWIISRISRTAKAVVETMEALDVDAVEIVEKEK